MLKLMQNIELVIFHLEKNKFAAEFLKGLKRNIKIESIKSFEF